MADWTYCPRPRWASQGAPQSPFQDGTPVGAGDRGVAWTLSILSPGAATPNLTVSNGQSQGYVLDDTDGELFDDVGNYTPHIAFPGGAITSITFGSSPAPFTPGASQYNYYLRRRSDSSTILIFHTDAGGLGHPGAGWPTYAVNPFTSAAWIASEIMGSVAAYDAYVQVVNILSGPLAGEDYIRYDSALQIAFSPTIVTPAVLAVILPAGTVDGGVDVTIRGRGFNAQTGVTFGGKAATNVVLVNDSTITATTPAHASGTVDVEVLSVAIGTALYTYVISPSFTLDPLPDRTPIQQGGGKRGR